MMAASANFIDIPIITGKICLATIPIELDTLVVVVYVCVCVYVDWWVDR